MNERKRNRKKERKEEREGKEKERKKEGTGRNGKEGKERKRKEREGKKRKEGRKKEERRKDLPIYLSLHLSIDTYSLKILTRSSVVKYEGLSVLTDLHTSLLLIGLIHQIFRCGSD